MNIILLEMLACPACLPMEVPLELERAGESGDDVVEGVLRCRRCGGGYPIRNGVAVVVAGGPNARERPAGRYEDPSGLSAYLWSHYAELFEDPEATPAYAQWSDQMPPSGGIGLDAGCAVGRFTFELGLKCDFAVGLDRSESFIAVARKLARARELTFELKEEGRICSTKTFTLPPHWKPEKVEFIVGDAQALPFRSGFFSGVASLNLLDKVPRPLAHVMEANRVARATGARLLISDPFSWSEEVCAAENWLGGTLDGKFPGPAMENISRLLSGRSGVVSPPWKVSPPGAVWWKIRNHRNHYEVIRSHYVRAER
jgi:SAM-dependent methyltransferase/uncharacterized protein YbaR (Trm112 family)